MDETQSVPQSVGSLKLMPHFVCRSKIQGTDLCQCDFMKCTFNIVMCQDTQKPICFKLGIC